MATELPYFRFVVNEWQNGKIAVESYEMQGLFISICGFYWLRDCSITLAMLQKKFSNANPKMIQDLIDLTIIKHEKRHDKIEIEFLSRQFDMLSEKRKLRQGAGSKGGNAKAMLKQKGSYKDKENNKDKDKENINNIEERKLKFATTLKPHVEKYGRDFLNEFYKYWVEPNKSNSKFKQELEKTWDLGRRLETWAKNEKNFNKKLDKHDKRQINNDQLDQLSEAARQQLNGSANLEG